MSNDAPPKIYRRIATRIIGVSLTSLLITLVMVSGTLWLSWQLEGSSAAINDTGSLRMRFYKLALELEYPISSNAASVSQQIIDIDSILIELEAGDPSRPLMLPKSDEIKQQYLRIKYMWVSKMRPFAVSAIDKFNSNNYGKKDYRHGLNELVGQADRLVILIEQNSERKANWLRFSQVGLISLSILSACLITYLLYLWIVRPVLILQQGLRKLAGHEFDVRLPVESQDEFGQLTEGFNMMAGELSGLYLDLEKRVLQKTSQLEQQNRELSTLYDTAAFLANADSIEMMSHGFLKRVVQTFMADGGSLRLLAPDGCTLHLTATEGLSGGQVENEYCLHIDGCHCGRAIHDGAVMIRDMRRLSPHPPRPCEQDGFVSLAVFQIVTQQRVIGSYSLHFRQEANLEPADKLLLQTLGRHLGASLENLRLQAKEKQLAVVEERQLVSQGLHDSLAQSLNFLNLQVQMLERELSGGNLGRAQKHLPLLRTGVEQSYQDVRELLANFRTKLESVDLYTGIVDTLARFQQQTDIETELDIQGQGAPLPPEQQLQILFVLQEALSNIRKHAMAQNVHIRVMNDHDFTLEIRDDGQGFDLDLLVNGSTHHYGLRIMRERAERLQAQLTVNSQPNCGTSVILMLAYAERIVA